MTYGMKKGRCDQWFQSVSGSKRRDLAEGTVLFSNVMARESTMKKKKQKKKFKGLPSFL